MSSPRGPRDVLRRRGGLATVSTPDPAWHVAGDLLGRQLRILPLSITLLTAAVGIPRFAPPASPRRVARLGLLATFPGIFVLLTAINPTPNARIVTIPLLLAGQGPPSPRNWAR